MVRVTFLTAVLVSLCATASFAQQSTTPDRDAIIRSAMSAALPEIAARATIMDWENNVLREGTNGFTCFPDMPETVFDDPMCLDDQWLAFVHAYLNKTEPAISRVGIAYMLRGEGSGSNVDPYATEPTEDNEWMEHQTPHLMLLVPDAGMLQGMSTDPHNGGPWVMWRNTPYAHIMVPVPAPE